MATPDAGEDAEIIDGSWISCGDANGAVTLESCLAAPHTAKYVTTIKSNNSIPENYYQRNEYIFTKKSVQECFIPSLFTRTKTGNNTFILQ